MKKLLFYIIYLSFLTVFCQEKIIKTEIKSKNIFDLSIIKVYPDSIPNISVVFQAKNEFGKPLWKLNKPEINVTENEKICEVKRLINISKNKPLNIGIVFDHSGSMIDNPSQMPKDVETMQDSYFFGIPFPKGYKMAIEFAKEGVTEFLNETEKTNDSILFVGFSNTVDKVFPLTNKINKIKSFVKKVKPEGRTAFYNALHLSIEKLSNSSNKSVIVALTDGIDNQSKYTFQEIIEYANQHNISIYNIGLGMVNEEPLKNISKETDGFYYYTNEPEKLKDIYLNIKKQLKSIYQLDYLTTSLDYVNKNREVKFLFKNDTLQFTNNSKRFELPKETIEYLIKKEKQRKIKRNRIVFGSFGILLLGFIGFIVYKKRKKKVEIIIKNIFPNPFENLITIKFNIYPKNLISLLKIYDLNGKVVYDVKLKNLETIKSIDLNDLKSGIYMVQISSVNEKSNSIKIIKK